jgi:uncharacterized LabA/DUF88 family protein
MEGIVERSVLLVDGANMHWCCKNIGLEVDYARLASFIGSLGQLQRAHYYTALAEGSEETLRPLVNWLAHNGYTVVSKEAREFVSSDGVRRLRGNMDVELAVDAMSLSGSVDHLYICSGNGDFAYLVAALQRRGRKVTIISSRQASLADSLRRVADAVIDLDDIREQIGRIPPAP